MFHARPDRARWSGRWLVLPELRIHPIELPHLAIGSPPQVAVPGVSQVEMRYFIEATGRVEARSKFVGEALVLDKPILARCSDRLLVQPHGIKVPAIEASKLCRHQCVLIPESRWVVFGPLAQLFPVR